jgi:hypothetical protein
MLNSPPPLSALILPAQRSCRPLSASTIIVYHMQKVLTMPPIALRSLPRPLVLRTPCATSVTSRATCRQPAIAVQLPETKLARTSLITRLDAAQIALKPPMLPQQLLHWQIQSSPSGKPILLSWLAMQVPPPLLSPSLPF